MLIRTAPRQRRTRRWRSRAAAVAALSILAPAAAAVAAPSAASAQAFPAPGTVVNCADYANIGWVETSEWFGIHFWAGFTNFQLVSATPTFNVVEARFAENGQDEPQSATWTNTQSQTFTIQATVGLDFKVTDWLSLNPWTGAGPL